MPTDKFIIKVHRSGIVEWIKDCNNISFSDIKCWLGVKFTDIKCRPLKDEIYAFYGNEKSKLLIFAIPERKFNRAKCGRENFMIHGIQANQFNILSTPPNTAV